jgi:hypothetical protein
VTVNTHVTTVAAGASGITLLTFDEHATPADDRRAMLTCR